MYAPALAIAWEIGRKNRWGFWLILAAVPAGALLYPLGADLFRASELLRDLSTLPMIGSLIGVFGVFNYTETNSTTGLPGYPSRLFTRPVRTWLLVSCPMLYGVVTVMLLYLAWAALILRPSGFVVPIVRPLLFL